MDANRQHELMEALLPQSSGWLDCGLDSAEIAELRAAAANNPAIAAELLRLQAWDRQLSSAIDEVPVPAGMADRLLAAVTSEQPQPQAEITPAVREVRLPRRRFMWAMGTVAALAGAVFMALWLRPSGTTHVASAKLLDDVRYEMTQWKDQAWQSNLDSAALEQYRVDDLVLVARPQRWRSVDMSLDHQAVAYELTSPGRPRAALLVMQAENLTSDLATFPSRVPLSNTEGVCLGAWQRNGHIYVLIVEGSPARFGSFIKELSTG